LELPNSSAFFNVEQRGHGVVSFDVNFLCSAAALAECPRWNRLEIALAGRSNVGKSSLLNALAGRANLARISKAPGRTRSLNFFTVGERVALVDLPGYGYAKMSRAEASKIALLMSQYIRQRRELRGVVLLVDARRGPGSEECRLLRGLHDPAWRVGPRLNLIVVATKSDKLKRVERGSAVRRFEAIATTPSLCSSRTGEGIEQLRRKILRLANDDVDTRSRS
jgi:GTP-binding protein